MSISNIIDYMSFFFVGKYINQNGISTRNLAPKIDDKKDIFSKTAKLVNLSLNEEFPKYKQPKSTVGHLSDLLKSHDAQLHFSPFKRTKTRNNVDTLASYCSFESLSSISFNLLSSLKDKTIPVLDLKTKRFLLNILTGVNTESRELFNSVYSNQYSNRFVHYMASPAGVDHIKLFLIKKEDNIDYLENLNLLFANLMQKTLANDNDAGSYLKLYTESVYNHSIGYLRDLDILKLPNRYISYVYDTKNISKHYNIHNFLLLDNLNLDSYYPNDAHADIIKSCISKCLSTENPKLDDANLNSLVNFPYNGSRIILEKDLVTSLKDRYQKVTIQVAEHTSKYIQLCKTSIRGETFYILGTNTENPFDEIAKIPLNITCKLKAPSLQSSAAYEGFMTILKQNLSIIFENT